MKNYNSNIKLSIASLNVQDLEKQTNFYRQIMGMMVLEEDEDFVLLGTSNKTPLLKLQKTSHKFVHSYDLYHIAYLVPTEQDLADILKHFITSQTRLEGGADYGYSNAIYLSDTEGNGIEVYYDKDESFWDRRPDRTIVGVTERLDAERLLDISKTISPYELPTDTIIGHIHLSVRDSKVSSAFYQNVLNFLDKFTVPFASWIAHGNYHHHLAVNNWAGGDLNNRQKDFPGLAYFEIIVTDKDEYLKLIQNIKATNTTIRKETNDTIFIEDPNGIEVRLIKEI